MLHSASPLNPEPQVRIQSPPAESPSQGGPADAVGSGGVFRAPGWSKSIDGNAFLIRSPSSRIARSSGVSGVRSNHPTMVPI